MSLFYGYPGQIWEVCYLSTQWYQTETLNATPAAALGPALLLFKTLHNGLYAVNAWQKQQAWNREAVLLTEVSLIPLGAMSADITVFNNRLASYIAGAAAAAACTPAVSVQNVVPLLSQGSPAVPDPLLIETLMAARWEPNPAGLTTTNLYTTGVNFRVALQRIAALLATYLGSAPTQGSDALNLAISAQTIRNQRLNDLVSAPDTEQVPGASDLSTLWNTMMVTPALSLASSFVGNAPSTSDAQQCGTIRYVLANLSYQIAELILILSQPRLQSSTSIAQIRQGDTLMDIAARETGDFERWSAIAQANNLTPPGIGPQTGAAHPGYNLIIPSSDGSTQPGLPTLDYLSAVLLTDLYLGDVNGAMPPWSGDFQVISGTSNLALSLGRRVQTLLGDLIYHPDFGSRIPTYVGSIQTTLQAQLIAAAGKSALQADPRVQTVESATATVAGPANAAIEFDGQVVPLGLPGVSVAANTRVGI